MSSKPIIDINELLDGYKVETNIGILPKVFFDYGLKDYFTKACEEFSINVFYGNFEVFSLITRGSLTRAKDIEFYKICKFTSLVYEGCIYNKLSYKDIQIALIYSLFNYLSFKKFFDEIHFSIKDAKKLNVDQIDELEWIFPKEKFKQTCDLFRVLTDAKEMYVYWCTPLDQELISKIDNHFSKMPGISSELCIEYIFTEILKTNWKTRWAKMKSFNRNFNKLVHTLKLETFEQLKMA